jgi:DNA-binding NarL/FixJ family response regulator
MISTVPLVVIDDHPIVHTGVLRWVAEASIPTGTVPAYRSVAEFLDAHPRDPATPEVIVFDPEYGEQRPDYVGLQELCKLQHRVVAYSRISSTEIILKCLDAGAANYIVKSEAPQHLIEAITAAQRGATAHGPIAAAAVRAAQQHGRPELTAQEKRVLIEWLLTDNKESVSKKLHIAPSTVRTHLQRIRRRYNEIHRSAPSKAALFARAVQDGLIGIHDV